MQPGFSLCVREDNRLELMPPSAAPRLSAALARGTGFGLLDVLKCGLPLNAPRCLHFLREKVRDTLAAWLRAMRTSGSAGEGDYLPDSVEAVRWLEAMPPLHGSAVNAATLRLWMREVVDALLAEALHAGISPEDWLARLGGGWRHVGRLCLHLAENGLDASGERPFAFLATFVHQIAGDDRPKHLPLGAALRLYAHDRNGLLSLLSPLRQAARLSPFLRGLIDSGRIFAPQAWRPDEAWLFLQAVPLLEEAGMEVRMVNLWKTRPPSVRLELTAEMEGDFKRPALNVRSVLRFSPALMLGTHALTDEEIQQLLECDDGLVRFQGEWVHVDRERLRHLLGEWRNALAMNKKGVPLLAGLRYLLGGGAGSASAGLPAADEDVVPKAGEGIRRLLKSWPPFVPEPKFTALLDAALRAYQKEGVRFLIGVTEAGFGACLADDMGLGKTLQVIAWLNHLYLSKELAYPGALVIVPASLLDNWREEFCRFAPHLHVDVLHSSLRSGGSEEKRFVDRPGVVLTTYGVASRRSLLSAGEWAALILDEAQSVKNAGARRSRAIKAIPARRRVALTGTPVENSVRELWSLFDFLTPGLLGSPAEFSEFLKKSGNNFAPLRRLIHPFMLRRLKTDPGLLPELPPKVEMPCFCRLTIEQMRLYRIEVENFRAVIQEKDAKTRLMLVLPILSRLKQICNHPAQYLGTGCFDIESSGKMTRLARLAGQIVQNGEKTLVFTQYRAMIAPLYDVMRAAYGEEGLVLHGGTPVAERGRLVERFQAPGGPPFFILSLRAAGTGLTLTQAVHVVHFDRWWNPAVENQASDRAHRIGQKRTVWIHPFICRGTIEENIHRLLTEKSHLAETLLRHGLEKTLLSLGVEELQKIVAL